MSSVAANSDALACVQPASSKSRSSVWTYFEKVSELKSKCNTCGRELKITTGCTSSMAKHLKLHKKQYSEFLQMQMEKQKPTHVVKKAQKTLPLLFAKSNKYSVDNPRAVSITKSIGRMIAIDLQPFSMVNDRGFVEMMNLVEPQYTIPDRTTFSRTVIPQMYEDTVKKVTEEMQHDFKNGVGSISYTTDMWTSRSHDSYLSLTCHYLTSDFVLVHHTLGNIPFSGEHSGAAICNVLLDVSNKWKIPQGVHVYVLSDNAKNIKLALSKTSWVPFNCLGHTLQLAVNDGKKETPGMESVCKKARSIVGHYKRSSQATQRLHTLQEQMGKLQHELIQDVETRWNSEYAMLLRLLEQKEVIAAELASSCSMDNLNALEWRLIAGVVDVLAPIYEATNDLCGEKYTTISMVIPIIDGIKDLLETFISRAEAGSGVVFARNMLKAMLVRFPDYRLREEYVISMIVDPRYKAILLHDHEKKKGLHSLKLFIESDTSFEGIHKEQTTGAQNTLQPSSSSQFSVWNKFDTASQSVAVNDPLPHESVLDDISRYINEPVISRHTDPFAWWKENQFRFRYISVVAKRLLSIPATSVPSERMFSTAGNIVSSRRECLAPELVEKLTFLHDNL